MSFHLIPIDVEGSGVQSVIKCKISFKDMCITQQKGRFGMFSRAPPMLDSIMISAEETPNNLSRGPTRLLSERRQAGDLRHTDTQAHLQKRQCSLSGI